MLCQKKQLSVGLGFSEEIGGRQFRYSRRKHRRIKQLEQSWFWVHANDVVALGHKSQRGLAPSDYSWVAQLLLTRGETEGPANSDCFGLCKLLMTGI